MFDGASRPSEPNFRNGLAFAHASYFSKYTILALLDSGGGSPAALPAESSDICGHRGKNKPRFFWIGSDRRSLRQYKLLFKIIRLASVL